MTVHEDCGLPKNTSPGLSRWAQGKKAVGGEQGAEGKMQGREQGGKFQIF